MYYVTTELYHHGILGMKWGKRNGPPYPLSSKDHSKSEKQAGWRKSLVKASVLTDSQINVAKGKNVARMLGDILKSPVTSIVGGGAALGIAGKVADKRNYKKYGNKNQNEGG